MPKFILDTYGKVGPLGTSQTIGPRPFREWRDLDSFTQGYIEAAFFTSSDENGNALEQGFAVLAPETLAVMTADCAKFCEGSAWLRAVNAAKYYEFPGEEQAGHDFWFTRNGHGCGFWDGDWPEPYATALTDAAKAFPERDLYVGDDGKIYA